MKNFYLLLILSLYVNGFAQNTVDSKILEVNWGGDSEPDHLTKIGEKLFFSAQIAAFFNGNGRELWVKDSPESKARIVKDISQTGSGIESDSKFINFNGILLFTGRSSNGQSKQLWRSDGTADGTYLLKIINTNSDTNINNPIIVGNKLFFSTYLNNSSDLWVTDGTTDGTFQVKKINLNGDSEVNNLFIFQDKIYFTANDGEHGAELWNSDGTENGTAMIMDFFPGIQKGLYRKPVVYKDEIYFVGAQNNINDGLWKWNSNSNSTTLIKNFPPYYNPFFDAVVANDSLYFLYAGQTQYANLWKTDGTVANTIQISTGENADSIARQNLRKFKNQIHVIVSKFFGDDAQWFLDLNDDSMKKVSAIIPSLTDAELVNSTSENNYLLFRKPSGEYSLTDGTNSGTNEISGVQIIANYTGYAYNLVDYNQHIFMNAKTPKYGVELFQYDTVKKKVELVEDLHHFYGSAALASETLNGKLIYFGKDNNHGLEVFTSDGTEEGTHLLKDLNLNYSDTIFNGDDPQFFKHNNKL